MAKKTTEETTAEVTPPTKVVTESDPNIEVVCEWRRAATKNQLVRLWGAMELGRSGVPQEVGDDRLSGQRAAYNTFARAVLGADAPVMEIG